MSEVHMSSPRVTQLILGTQAGPNAGASAYRGTLLTRNNALQGPYRRTIPRVPWWSLAGGLFLMSEVPLYRLAPSASTDLSISIPCMYFTSS